MYNIYLFIILVLHSFGEWNDILFIFQHIPISTL